MIENVYEKLIIPQQEVSDYTRHLIVGDIHGQFDELLTLLADIGYDSDVDFLYTVGDMIDRGNKSVDVVRFFTEHPRRFSTMGNHELMFWDDPSLSNPNGGYTTRINLDENNLEYSWIKEKCENLPVILDVHDEKNDFTFRLTHADISVNLQESDIQTSIKNEDFRFINNCLWGRNTIYHLLHNTNDADGFARTVSTNHPIKTFVGHTIINDVISLGTRTFLNAPMGDLFVVNALTNDVYKYSEIT